MNSMPEDKAKALCELLDLDNEVAKALQVCPHKQWDKTVPTDPLVYAGISTVLVGVTLLASLLPALRASRVDPVTALHNE